MEEAGLDFTVKDLEKVFVKREPASFLDRVQEKLSEQGTWRGFMMIFMAFIPQLRQLGVDTDVLFNVFTGVAMMYGVQNIWTKN